MPLYLLFNQPGLPLNVTESTESACAKDELLAKQLEAQERKDENIVEKKKGKGEAEEDVAAKGLRGPRAGPRRRSGWPLEEARLEEGQERHARRARTQIQKISAHFGAHQLHQQP